MSLIGKLRNAIVANDVIAALSLIDSGDTNVNCNKPLNNAVANVAAEESLLNVASDHTDHRITSFLLDSGASLDNVTVDHLFSLVSHVSVVKSLLARNVNVAALRDSNGCNLCRSIVGASDDAELLRGAIEAAGLDVNAADDDRMAPLHVAASLQKFAAIRCLVELGADIDQQQLGGATSLHLACVNCDEINDTCEGVELLLALGADCHVTNGGGLTPCHWSITVEGQASLRAILAAGGDLDQPDTTGVTPREICMVDDRPLPTANEIETVHRRIAKMRLDLVRQRAAEICFGLQSRNIDALQLCEILMHSFGALGSLIQFHQWWMIATKVKHFHKK